MPDEQFLDGYRSGLGAAIRAVTTVRTDFPRLTWDSPHVDDLTRQVVDSLLEQIASGLRIISASVVLDDGEVRRDA